MCRCSTPDILLQPVAILKASFCVFRCLCSWCRIGLCSQPPCISLVKFISVFAGCTYQSLEYDSKQHSIHMVELSVVRQTQKCVDPPASHRTSSKSDRNIMLLFALGFCLSQVYVYRLGIAEYPTSTCCCLPQPGLSTRFP